MRIDLVLEPDTPARFKALGLLAEQLGFGAVWTANHIAARDPFMSFMPLAEQSSTVRMGPVAVSPYELHPVKIANQLYTLNEHSGGRANIVIGGGGGSVIAMGMKPGRRQMMPRMVATVRECVEFLRGAATERPFHFDGEFFQIQGYMPAWQPTTSAQIYVGATKPQMLRMAARVADGVMMSDTTLPRMQESMQVLTGALQKQGRAGEKFPVSNLYAWHIKTDRDAAYREARAKLFVRGMLENWYVAPFLDADECAAVEEGFPAFAQAYMLNSPAVEGVPDGLVNKLVDNLTWTGDYAAIDRCIDEIVQFKNYGLTELAIRLYAEPESSMRVIAERVLPALG